MSLIRTPASRVMNKGGTRNANPHRLGSAETEPYPSPSSPRVLIKVGKVQVWVITGDKQETAINIAISCKLVRNPSSLLICNETSADAAHNRLQELGQRLQRQYEPVQHHNPTPFAGELLHTTTTTQQTSRLLMPTYHHLRVVRLARQVSQQGSLAHSKERAHLLAWEMGSQHPRLG